MVHAILGARAPLPEPAARIATVAWTSEEKSTLQRLSSGCGPDASSALSSVAEAGPCTTPPGRSIVVLARALSEPTWPMPIMDL